MRKHLFQMLEDMGLDPTKEYDRLYQMVFRENVDYRGSLSVLIDQDIFRRIPLHGSCLSLFDMMEDLGMYPNEDRYWTLDELFLLCELFINVFKQGRKFAEEVITAKMDIITAHINFILEKANYELITNDKNQCIIVEKNKAATQAAESVATDEAAFKILEYNHYALKGNLAAKQSILNAIGSYVEPMLNDGTFKGSEYKQLADDVRFLLNNFHIRHNNKTGKSENPFIRQMAEKELEAWYDKAYNTLLMLIIAKEQIQISKELKSIKQAHLNG